MNFHFVQTAIWVCQHIVLNLRGRVFERFSPHLCPGEAISGYSHRSVCILLESLPPPKIVISRAAIDFSINLQTSGLLAAYFLSIAIHCFTSPCSSLTSPCSSRIRHLSQTSRSQPYKASLHVRQLKIRVQTRVIDFLWFLVQRIVILSAHSK